MKNLYVIVFLLAGIFAKAQCPESFHDFSAEDIYGQELPMSTFAGKKLLVVNTASFCGYTTQYSQLQTLYDTYGGDNNPYNFEIIGFPANNFGNQEPYDEDSIIGVCQNYGITFTMMSKVSVKGIDQHEIYKWLTLLSRNCVQNAPVTWNFQKFLINPDGSWHATKTPATSPLHTSIVNWITGTAAAENTSGNQSHADVFVNQADKRMHVSIISGINQNFKVSIYGINGQLIETIYDGSVSGNHTATYNTSHLNPGIYMVEVASSYGKEIKKLAIY